MDFNPNDIIVDKTGWIGIVLFEYKDRYFDDKAYNILYFRDNKGRDIIYSYIDFNKFLTLCSDDKIIRKYRKIFSILKNIKFDNLLKKQYNCSFCDLYKHEDSNAYFSGMDCAFLFREISETKDIGINNIVEKYFCQKGKIWCYT